MPCNGSDGHYGGLEYIREHYGVPAVPGGQVRFEGRRGTIVGTADHYLRIHLGDEKHPATFHPTWHLEYDDNCPECGGTGIESVRPGDPEYECAACDGTGSKP